MEWYGIGWDAIGWYGMGLGMGWDRGGLTEKLNIQKQPKPQPQPQPQQQQPQQQQHDGGQPSPGQFGPSPFA